MDFCSDGVMTPWMIGTTADEPHSGQAGGFFGRLSLARCRTILLLVIAARQFVSLQVIPLTIESPRARVQRNIIGRFFVVGAELANIDRFEVVRGNKILTFLDAFA
jgi:hypothetical protein